jgi:hypothetical protein
MTNTAKKSCDSSETAQTKRLNDDIYYGAVWVLAGLLVTAFTNLSASSTPGGGTWIFAWGAIIHGLKRVHRGLPPSPAVAGSEMLNQAELLESVNSEQAIAKYKDIIRQLPGTLAGEEARRNIEILRACQNRD